MEACIRQSKMSPDYMISIRAKVAQQIGSIIGKNIRIIRKHRWTIVDNACTFRNDACTLFVSA